MRGLIACSFVALLAVTNVDARTPKCTVRAHLQANANDGDAFSSPAHSSITGKNIVIEKIPTLSENDVVAFRPYPATDGSYGALFQLNEHGKVVLDTLSLEHRGAFLYVFVNGRPAAELQIDRRVSDGKLYVASSLTAADLQMMKKQWPLIGHAKR